MSLLLPCARLALVPVTGSARHLAPRGRIVPATLDRHGRFARIRRRTAEHDAVIDGGSEQVEQLVGPAAFAGDVDPYRPAEDIAGELGIAAFHTEEG